MIDWNKVAAASGDPEATWNDGAMAMLQEYDRQRREKRVSITWTMAAPVGQEDAQAAYAVARRAEAGEIEGDRAEQRSVHDRFGALAHRYPELATALLGRHPYTKPLARTAMESAMRAGGTDQDALVAAIVALDGALAGAAEAMLDEALANPAVPR